MDEVKTFSIFYQNYVVYQQVTALDDACVFFLASLPNEHFSQSLPALRERNVERAESEKGITRESIGAAG